MSMSCVRTRTQRSGPCRYTVFIKSGAAITLFCNHNQELWYALAASNRENHGIQAISFAWTF